MKKTINEEQYRFEYQGFEICMMEVAQESPYENPRYDGVEIHSYQYANSCESNSFKTKKEAIKEFINETGNRFGEQLNLIPVFGDDGVLTLTPQSGEFLGYIEAPYYLETSDIEDFVSDMDFWVNHPKFRFDIIDAEGNELGESCMWDGYDECIALAKEMIDEHFEQLES